MRDLPLNALRAFVAVYESGGVRPAARQLSVSPSAIHRHLRALEARIGISLIETQGHVIIFTPSGERLARRAQEAMSSLLAGVENASEDRGANSLVIATTESFAARWLVPRLSRFLEHARHVRLSLNAERAMTVVPRDASLAIRMGSGPWPGEICEPLMDEQIFPVMSPSVWRAAGQPSDPTALVDLPLLHDRDPQTTWRRWAAARGLPDDKMAAGARFSSTNLLVAAAEAGLGVAIARGRLAETAIASGALFDGFRSSGAAIGTSYWLVRGDRLRPIEEQFIEWLRREAAASSP